MKNEKSNWGSFAIAKLQAKLSISLLILSFAVIGFTMAACDVGGGDDDDDDNNSNNNNVNLSLDGVWVSSSGGAEVTVSGSSGIYTKLTTTDALFQSAVNKGYIIVGTTQLWRNLTSTGNLTWSGQKLHVQFYVSSPNVAIGTVYRDYTFTMSSNGQTLTEKDSSGNVTSTWTRKTTQSLDGVWGRNDGEYVITANGRSGIISSIDNPLPLLSDAVNKGWVKVGDQFWRNLTSTGNLTWSGQTLNFWYNTASPNVCTKVDWTDFTLTMSENGQTITKGSFTNADQTFTRRR